MFYYGKCRTDEKIQVVWLENENILYREKRLFSFCDFDMQLNVPNVLSIRY